MDTSLPSVAMRQNLTALLWETKVSVVANIAHSQCPLKRVEEFFATVYVCSNRSRIVRVMNNKRKHINCPSLPRGTSNIVAEGDGIHAYLTDTACRVPTTFAVYVILNAVKNLSDTSLHCAAFSMTLARFVILNEVKNLPLRIIRYFTTLRFVQYDTCARFILQQTGCLHYGRHDIFKSFRNVGQLLYY